MAGTSTQHKIFQNSYFFNKATSTIEVPFSAVNFSEKLLFWKQLIFQKINIMQQLLFSRAALSKRLIFQKSYFFATYFFRGIYLLLHFLSTGSFPVYRRAEHFSEYPAFTCYFFTVAHTTLPSPKIAYLKSFASKLISQGNMNKNINRKMWKISDFKFKKISISVLNQ